MLQPFLLIPLLVFVLGGCGVYQAKPEAEALVTRYFAAIKAGAFQEVVPLFSEDFYKKMPKEELVKDLEKNNWKLGTLEEYTLLSIQVEVNSSRGGTLVTLLYQVKYSHHEAQETFIVFKPSTAGPAAIIRHQISSKGFLFAVLASRFRSLV